MRDELMSREDAIEVLSPHLPFIGACIEEGWGDWQVALQTDVRWATPGRRTRASAVYDFIAARAETYFESVGIETTRKKGFLLVQFAEGMLNLRFKKFRNDKLATSGIPTLQRLEIEKQQVTLANGLTPTYIVAGYLPDELELGLDVVAIVCSFDGSALWQIDLRDTQSAALPIATDLPVPPTVRSRGAAERTKEEAEGS